jgi:uncharacterized protein (TIGR03086 family)
MSPPPAAGQSADVTHDKLIEFLDRTRTSLTERLAAIGPDQWDLPSPCIEWSVRDVVVHLAVSEMAVGPMIRNEPIDFDPPDLLGDDPSGAWGRLASQADAELLAPGALSGTATHPFLGVIDTVRLAMMRIVDRTVHGWDIAVATGFVPPLPLELASDLIGIAEARADQVPRGFLFADSPQVAAAADATTKLVAIYGRDAEWKQ